MFAERDAPGLKLSLFDEERNLDIVNDMKLRVRFLKLPSNREEQKLWHAIKLIQDAAFHEKFMSALLDPVDYTAPYVERTDNRSNNLNDSNMDEKILKEKSDTNEKAKLFLKKSIVIVRVNFYTINL